MKRELTVLDLALVLAVTAGGVATLCCAFVSFFDGRDWPALWFACGGIFLSVWAGLRLTSGEPTHR